MTHVCVPRGILAFYILYCLSYKVISNFDVPQDTLHHSASYCYVGAHNAQTEQGVTYKIDDIQMWDAPKI